MATVKSGCALDYMNRATAGLVALAVAIGFSASCSSSSGSGNATSDAGTKDATSSSSGGSGSGSGSGGMQDGTSLPPADAFIQASVGTGSQSSAAMCPLAGVAASWLDIGQPTAGKPTTVQDGGGNGTGNVSVSCTVYPSGSGFDIYLKAAQLGAQGASITISSVVGQGAVTTSGGTGISATFTSYSNGGPYQSSNCTITFIYQGQAVPVSPPVAAGRIWGHVSCPAAGLSGQPGKQCDAEADFLFEQCGQ